MSGIFLEQQVMNQMIELGWVDVAKVEEMRAALDGWSEHPDAFRANMYCTALGWKE